jgi:hypothetical protein
MAMRILLLALIIVVSVVTPMTVAAPEPASSDNVVDATTFHHKIMAGYQGWFRCPGDAANLGWVHWSRDGRRISPKTLSFEMWPDMSEYGPGERFAAPGFSYPDGTPAELFSSDNAATVLRHFQWMRDYGIDGAWLQHFVVDLPGGPAQNRYPSRLRVLHYVADAANKTGRTWALTYDISGMPADRIFPVLTEEWKKLVDDKVIDDPRYLHEGARPVVQIWGFYSRNRMSADQANQLIDFFKSRGKYSAFVYGGGDWNWRGTDDPKWQAIYRRLDAYSPWNVGNYGEDAAGDKHASMGYWPDDKKEFERTGGVWVPVIYPGFSWDNLQQKPPGATTVPRRGGKFLWEQFVEVTKLKPESVFVAMFDEVDEGTAIFKVTSAPPTQGHFVGYEGLPSDWYLRVVKEGARMWRGQIPQSAEIPIQPAKAE